MCILMLMVKFLPLALFRKNAFYTFGLSLSDFDGFII